MTKVHVDEHCIRAGQRGDPVRCPVAIAIREVVRTGVSVSVGGCRVSLDNYNGLYGHTLTYVPLPVSIAERIRAYDAYTPMVEFDFELPIDDVFLLPKISMPVVKEEELVLA